MNSNEKNKIELTDKELDLLAEMVYLGNWVINSCRLPANILKEYELLFDKIADIYEKRKIDLEPEVEIDEPLKHFHELTEDHIDYYNNDILFDLLAEKLAEFKFPIDYEDTENLPKALTVQIAAKRAYEKELATNNLTNLEINIPDFKNQQDAALKRYMKISKKHPLPQTDSSANINKK